jgi:hypothetical protein
MSHLGSEAAGKMAAGWLAGCLGSLSPPHYGKYRIVKYTMVLLVSPEVPFLAM